MKLPVKDWCAWVSTPLFSQDHSKIIVANELDCSFIPAMQRRRLSLLDKGALYTSYQLYQRYQKTNWRTLFATQHGQLSRSCNIITQIINKDPVSPTEFSTSVFNTSAGLYSILTHSHLPTHTISAGNDTLIATLLEAFALNQNSNEDLLVNISDVIVPEVYQAYSDLQFNYSISLLISNDAIQEIMLKRESFQEPSTENPIGIFLKSLTNPGVKWSLPAFEDTYALSFHEGGK